MFVLVLILVTGGTFAAPGNYVSQTMPTTYESLQACKDAAAVNVGPRYAHNASDGGTYVSSFICLSK